MEKKKAIAYLRTSTNKQEYSFEAQKAAIDNFCERANFEVIEVIEERKSGKLDDRAGLAKALALAKTLNATLIVAKLDRLSRHASFLMSLAESEISFICADMPELNTLTLGIFAVMAQHERELIASRTKAGLEVAKAKGKRIGNPAGFSKVGKKARRNSAKARKAIALENEANKASAKAIAFLLKKNKTLREIAADLEGMGFTTSEGKQHTAMSVCRLIKMFDLKK